MIRWLPLLSLGVNVLSASNTGAAPAIDYGRQVLPVLAENCFACHGPDEMARKARLRLDTREGATAMRKRGAAIVPGKSADSTVVKRICEMDEDLVMPPPKTGKRLRPEQIALLKEWIDQGAPYATHWSLSPPRKSPLPRVADPAWPRNPIDTFILARLEAAGLKPSPEAEKTRLLRRVTLDLTGLPPTPAEVDAFLADKAPGAYERVVDRLLESSRYGEHMARFWLDAARYGDTHGLHLDNYREMWPYRDWVVRAFNRNLPYDQFLIEQIAGDLLPGATQDQAVASGFNRCHVSTSEGGSIDEECYVRNVVDRIDTFGTVVLGLSLGCCRCHDHKYDPFTQKDYYSLFAFFNSLDDRPLDGNAQAWPPVIRVTTPDVAQALDELGRKTEAIKKAIAQEVAKVKIDEATAPAPGKAQPSEYVWIDDALPAGAKWTAGGPNLGWSFVAGPSNPVFSGEKSLYRTGSGLTQNYFEGATPGLQVGEGDVLFAYVYLDPKRPPREIMLQWNTGAWAHRAYWGENVIPWGADNSSERRHLGPLPEKGKWVRLEVEASKVGIRPGATINGWAFTQHDGTCWWDRSGIITRTPQPGQTFESFSAWLKAQEVIGGVGLPDDVKKLVRIEAKRRTAEQNKRLRDHFIEHAYFRAREVFAPLHRQLADLEPERKRLEGQAPTTLVSHELPTPRPAYVLKRGEYDKRGEQVGRRLPLALPPLPPGASADRLGLARWLVHREHPLTSRVIVNRLWQQVFGAGLVKTAEDFGAQGELPSHPELLDWLAVQFQDDSWDVKRFLRRLVLSATYRQTSRVTHDRLAKDPGNRLLSRGPRFRLDGETLRDQALFVSGLLVEKMGGPSVKPPQPAGLWEAVGYVSSNTARFSADTGADKVHRRSLYTFWKRTAPPPQMSGFDAPSREACCVRRERTNTPLQALLLLNEQQYVEAARALAGLAVKEGGATPEARAAWVFKRALGRAPDAAELAELVSAYRDHLETYKSDLQEAKKLVGTADAELAAWAMVANLILNLDEIVTKG